MPDVAVDQLFKRLAVRERDKLLQVAPIGRESMSGVTTVDFEVFEPGRDGIGHRLVPIQESSAARKFVLAGLSRDSAELARMLTVCKNATPMSGAKRSGSSEPKTSSPKAG